MNLPQSIQPVDATHVLYRGRRLVYFGGCDYYRLTRHPHLLKAHAQAVARDGLGTGASRMTTGNHPTHDALEAVLKKFFDCESATVIGDGYLANIALGQALGSGAKAFDALLIDEYAHLSLRDAAKFVGCPVVTYRHCDGDDLAKRLAKRKNDRQILLLTDGVFGATGRITPIANLAKVLPHGSVVWVDDAHGAGVLGDRLRGTVEHVAPSGFKGRELIQSTTLSKAFGSYGGAILGPTWLRKSLLDSNRVVTGSSSLPAAYAAAAQTALGLLRTRPGLAKRLQRNTVFVKDTLRESGLAIDASVFPVVSLNCPAPKEATVLRRRLLANGIYPSCIRYPSDKAEAFYRFAISSEHTRAQLEKLAEALCP